MHAVIMEAYVHGVSTRKIDDLVAALVSTLGISKTEVSRICAGLDEQILTVRSPALVETVLGRVPFCRAIFRCVRAGPRRSHW